MGRAGRPRRQGERYPSGQLRQLRDKPNNEGLPPALLARIKNFFVKLAKDPRHAGLVSMMLYAGDLNSNQAAAAHKVGDVYRTYHRLKSLKEHTKSPNYERGFGNADLAEERMNPDELENFEVTIRRATEAWEKLDGFLAGLHREVRQAMLDLCVYETVPRPGTMPHCRWALDQLARRWAEGWRDNRVNKGDQRELRVVKTVSSAATRGPMRRKDTITEPFEMVLAKLRPDLDQDGIRQATETFYALRARMEFRVAKVKKNLR